MREIEQLLAGTPYLVAEDSTSQKRFESAATRSVETRERVIKANERIRAEAKDLLQPYLRATRMDLVAESNVIEGLRWSQHEVRQVVAAHRELLDGSVRTLVESVRSDARVYEVLGLYRAHEIAETWSTKDRVPRAHEVRGLHELILGDVPGSGQYKNYENAIGGTKHRTALPADTPRAMLELADWWGNAREGDPLLTATVVHAWLAHVHPFEDGNGRLARILANLELARQGYPPLVIRAESDRGEYYSALAASDDGDLLPLYELFGRALRRQARIMSRPDYVLELINDRLLATETQRYKMWATTLGLFASYLETSLSNRGAKLEVQGRLDPTSFSLLCDRDVDGNSWFAKIRRPHWPSEWLLWFGYRTQDWMDLAGEEHVYPSIFISRRDRSAEATHPFTPSFADHDVTGRLPHEICIVPAVHSPVGVRIGYDIRSRRPDAAADELADQLASVL